ncbi:GTP cyclohydrolase I FolE2 [Rheinheimera sp. YQF-2]|uniref:GTP cyclohydrolase I FolE2 n=1 Tax=Rheinheimera lutimaris TaxID=2740584 RepID=A0A7Y5EJD9_9GAMM|nr:GTP cyclohydrolase FolE2 [Rheinheimera lutimaris]NRQ44474.1 GTP cyclohydrolase I FolE2 [Rheinheimera lutimaris]
MNFSAPADTAHAATPAFAAALDSVGMRHIDVIFTLADHPDSVLSAKADISVNLPRSDKTGIHMSRLYQHLYQWTQAEPVSPATLHALLNTLLYSQQECGSSSAAVRLRSQLLLHRPALKTEDLAGCKAYPLELEACLDGDKLSVSLNLDIGYSSTCPCSATLSRQLLSEQFCRQFAAQPVVDTRHISQWLLQHASLATPHSQRSTARLNVDINPAHDNFGVVQLIDLAEHALATPLQTAVKRADEQEFARLNGANLMFVEDAARRLHAALKPHYPAFSINVAHHESLHPHDAVASVSHNR